MSVNLTINRIIKVHYEFEKKSDLSDIIQKRVQSEFIRPASAPP
jgi:hypothetical protein